MEFEKEWLELAKKAMLNFERMLEMEKEREERWSKPIPTEIVSNIPKIASAYTIKKWYEQLKNIELLYDPLVPVEEFKKNEAILNTVIKEMKEYV